VQDKVFCVEAEVHVWAEQLLVLVLVDDDQINEHPGCEGPPHGFIFSVCATLLILQFDRDFRFVYTDFLSDVGLIACKRN
jgi:hypothetical protein